ncbi:MAG: winged helix-turn-helix domain-containing protein, partial [Bryobacterales bacterium]|nr:winged helix-turn-helix domain-containing protein [Bryobacterales bacterium]
MKTAGSVRVVLNFAGFGLDVGNRCLWRAAVRVPLAPKAFDVLCHLAQRPGQLVTPGQLLEALWPGTYVQPEVLRRYILEIRKALGDPADAPRIVETVAKRGYRFVAPVTDWSLTPAPGAKRIVGRERDLRFLAESWERVKGGQRQLVFVSGEAGIGKTTLLEEFRRRTPDGDWLIGHCFAGFCSLEAYYPVLEALSQLARTRTRLAETLAKHAPTWLAQLPSLLQPGQRTALNQEILG